MKFRKKPVVIEAVQLTDATYHEAYAFVGDAVSEWCWDSPIAPMAERYIKIKTLEGVMTASENDWLIRGVAGEIYPCKPDIFELTYEAVPAVGQS